MKTWPVIPGVPLAGHVTSRGFWHPGRAAGCVKCEPELRSCQICWGEVDDGAGVHLAVSGVWVHQECAQRLAEWTSQRRNGGQE